MRYVSTDLWRRLIARWQLKCYFMRFIYFFAYFCCTVLLKCWKYVFFICLFFVDVCVNCCYFMQTHILCNDKPPIKWWNDAATRKKSKKIKVLLICQFALQSVDRTEHQQPQQRAIGASNMHFYSYKVNSQQPTVTCSNLGVTNVSWSAILIPSSCLTRPSALPRLHHANYQHDQHMKTLNDDSADLCCRALATSYIIWKEEEENRNNTNQKVLQLCHRYRT